MSSSSLHKEFAYPEQIRILTEVFNERNALYQLIDKMRKEYWRQLRQCKSAEERAQKRKTLSCVIWLVGKAWKKEYDFLRIDHSYFIEASEIGIGLSIHPQDSWKACEPFFHPHQTEIFVPVEGSIELEYIEDGKMVSHVLRVGDTKTLANNVCHRVVYRELDDSEASYFFIKTNLRKEPDKKTCDECDQDGNCPMQAKYQKEISSVDLSSVKCPRCGGDGWTMYRRDLSGAWDDIPCPECNPDGKPEHHRWTE